MDGIQPLCGIRAGQLQAGAGHVQGLLDLAVLFLLLPAQQQGQQAGVGTVLQGLDGAQALAAVRVGQITSGMKRLQRAAHAVVDRQGIQTAGIASHRLAAVHIAELAVSALQQHMVAIGAGKQPALFQCGNSLTARAVGLHRPLGDQPGTVGRVGMCQLGQRAGRSQAAAWQQQQQEQGLNNCMVLSLQDMPATARTGQQRARARVVPCCA
jgi:hypothetical protein